MRSIFLATIYLILSSIYSQAQTQTVQDDFEGNGTITSWYGDNCNINTDFGNPYSQGINTSATVMKYNDVGGQYANVRFDISENYDLSSSPTFSLKIYVPSSGITGAQPNQVSLKLQDGTLNQPWLTQCEIIKPIELDQWQIVTFDFLNDDYLNFDTNSLPPTQRADFNQVLIQVNGENNNDLVVAYIDDFSYDGTLPGGSDSDFDVLVWSDEFDVDGAVDNTKWHHETLLPNAWGWHNGEIQHYTDRTDNSYVSDGILYIVGKKETYTDQGLTTEYTSARLNSKFAFQYGKVEVRAKLPAGLGTWPAIWMLGKNINADATWWDIQGYGTTLWPDCGEIDIMEHWGSNQNYVSSATHTPSSYGGTINVGGQRISNASTQFHTYTLKWFPEKLEFSVDGVTHYIYQPEERNSDTWPFDAEQFLLLNFAFLPEIDPNFVEDAMEIDYVRVYQKSQTTEPRSQIFPYKSDDNTVLLMPFDGDLTNTSPLSEDATANGNAISYSNSALQNFDQCLSLDGSSFLTVPHNTNLNLNGDWTIEAWINVTAFNPNALSMILQKPGDKDEYFSNYALELNPYMDNCFHGLYFTNEEARVDVRDISPELNKWYHVAFIRDASNSGITLNIHDAAGELVSSTSQNDSGSGALLNSRDIKIGENFEGYIDELRISNVVRSFPPPKADYFNDYDAFIAKLTELTASEDNASELDAFWEELIAYENFPFAIGTKVAFLYRGTATSISWAGEFNEWDMNADQGVRMGVSNIWLLEKEFATDARYEYKIIKNGSEWMADPNNPYPPVGEYGNSDLRMPDFVIALTSTSNSLSGFYYSTEQGPSSSQHFSISGSNLEGSKVTVSAPSNYEISTDNSTFTSSIDLPYTESTLSAIDIYVRLKAGLSAGNYEQSITISDNGSASDISINLSGEVSNDGMLLLRSNSRFELWGLSSEEAAADTVIKTMSANYDRVADSLNVELTKKIKVFVYESVDALHIGIGWPDAPDWLVGTANGADRIDIVSPYNPDPSHNFDQICGIAIHEMVHCFVHTLADGMYIPIWINEGAANYLAAPTQPDKIAGFCYNIDLNDGVILSLDELNVGQTFGEIGGYGFSGSIAHFIIKELGGSDVLSRFIASGALNYSILGYENKQEFQDAWHQYLYINYACNYSGLHAAFLADEVNGTGPFSVEFSDYSVHGGTTITSWNWDFDNDGNIDSNSQKPTWTYNVPGTYSVSLTISDGTNSSTYTKKNYIKVQNNTGTVISEFQHKLFSVYPNPSSKLVYISVPRKSDLSIFTLSGLKVLEKKNFKSGFIDVTNFSKGVYLVSIRTENGIITKKLVVE